MAEEQKKIEDVAGRLKVANVEATESKSEEDEVSEAGLWESHCTFTPPAKENKGAAANRNRATASGKRKRVELFLATNLKCSPQNVLKKKS